MVAGLLPVVAGMAWLAQITPATRYLPGVLGPMLLLGAGMGVVFVPLTMASLAGVRPEDSGAASSMVNVTQQVGGSLGLAILVTVLRHGEQERGARRPVAWVPRWPRRRHGRHARHGERLRRRDRLRRLRAAGDHRDDRQLAAHTPR